MKRKKDTNSTQKLLEHIRKGDQTVTRYTTVSSSNKSERESSFFSNLSNNILTNISKAGDKIKSLYPYSFNTAIELTEAHIRLLTFEQKTGTIYNYQNIPLEIAIDSEEFPIWLKRVLTDFIGRPSGSYNLWAIMPSKDLDLHIINIPKVKDKNIPDTLFWSLKKEQSIEERDLLIDYEVQEEIVERGVNKLSVLAVTTSYTEVQSQKELFEKAGFSLTGISVKILAFQNLLKKHMQNIVPRTVSILYIGESGTSISIFENGALSMLRNIRTGTESMVEELESHLPEIEEDIGTFEYLDLEESAEQKPSLVEEETYSSEKNARRNLYSIFSEHSASTDQETDIHIEREEIFEIIHPTIQRLTRQVERSFSYYSQSLSRDPVERIYLCGDAAACPEIKNHIQEQLGIETYHLNAFADTEVPRLNGKIPEQTLDAIQFSLLYGLALSDNFRDINLIYNYSEKRFQKQIYRINEIVIATSAAIALFLGGTYFWQSKQIEPLKEEQKKLEENLNNLSPFVEKQQLVQLASRVKEKQTTLKEYSHRFIEMATFTEIMQNTPSGIKLHQIDVESKPKFDNDNNANKDFRKGNVIIKGVVLGNKSDFQPRLASYMLNLRSSAVLTSPNIQQREVKQYKDKGKVLYFVISIKMV